MLTPWALTVLKALTYVSTCQTITFSRLLETSLLGNPNWPGVKLCHSRAVSSVIILSCYYMIMFIIFKASSFPPCSNHLPFLFSILVHWTNSSHPTLEMSPFLIAFVFQDVSASFNSMYSSLSKLWVYSGDNLVICEIWILTRLSKRKKFQFISICDKQYTVMFRVLG